MINNIFEQIRKINKYGSEYWSARDLYKILGYTEYGKFIPAIERAQDACKNSNQPVQDHFAHVSEMIKIATGTEKETFREVNDYKLSRYACYLIAQNGDSRKEEIALTQTQAKIKRENIRGESKANQTHYSVGKKIRKTIREFGGTMPEKLQTPEHIRESKKRLKSTKDLP